MSFFNIKAGSFDPISTTIVITVYLSLIKYVKIKIKAGSEDP